jgi:hypothetical protein
MNMFKAKWFGPLAGAMVLALSVVSTGSAAELYRSPEVSSAAAATPAPAPIWLGIVRNPDPPFTCNAWVVTNYWSDAAHTTKLGQCSITCNQYTQGTAYPTPAGGGACTGVTSSSYTNQLTTICRCVP